MTIIQLAQGMYRDLDGTPKSDALAMMAATDADFVARHPECAPYHRPSWREFEARAHETAPWGYVWMVVDDHGVLQFHSAQLDSSG